jgi:hypothetical protein
MTTPINPYASPAMGPPPLVASVAVEDAVWTIDYELTIDDHIAWNMFFQRTSPVARRQALLAWMLVGIVLFLSVLILPSLSLNWPESIMVSGVAAIPSLILWSFVPLLRRGQVKRIIRRMYVEGHNYNLIGPRRLTISREFLAVASPWSHSLTRWAGIAEIRREPEAVYFCIASSTAVIAPRRAFATDEQFRQFAQAAGDFQSQARNLAVA